MKLVDQMGETIRLDKKPKRIISLVPSQTELLFDLDLHDEIIGITKFCIHPEEWYRNKTRVGGTKSVNLEKVRELKPDLILGNKEENEQSDIESIREIAPVWMSDINDLDSALDMIEQVSQMTDRSEIGRKLCLDIQSAFEQLRFNPETYTAAYYIWREPNMVAGQDTFIDDMMKRVGFTNVHTDTRYPSDLNPSTKPELILLSSEPYPFKEEHKASFAERFPMAKILLVDGEMFSWYGSRLLHAPKYFLELRNQLT